MGEGYMGTLCYLCNFSLNLQLQSSETILKLEVHLVKK